MSLSKLLKICHGSLSIAHDLVIQDHSFNDICLQKMVNLKRTIADWMASQPFIGISPTNSEVINSVRVIDIHLQSLEVLGRMYIETRKNVFKKKMAKICEMIRNKSLKLANRLLAMINEHEINIPN